MNLVEMDNDGRDQLATDYFSVDTLPMSHIESSIGYRITGADGTIVAYSGDTDYCKNAVALARDANLFICESALPDAMKVEGHLTPSLAGRIVTEAGVKKLLLTHFYPECESVDIEVQCRKDYKGPLIVARDLMVVDV
jgi:ribonuclease BN (tRNA processing enzyme)